MNVVREVAHGVVSNEATYLYFCARKFKSTKIVKKTNDNQSCTACGRSSFKLFCFGFVLLFGGFHFFDFEKQPMSEVQLTQGAKASNAWYIRFFFYHEGRHDTLHHTNLSRCRLSRTTTSRAPRTTEGLPDGTLARRWRVELVVILRRWIDNNKWNQPVKRCAVLHCGACRTLKAHHPPHN